MEHGITESFFAEWLERFADDPEIKEKFAMLEHIRDGVFSDTPHIDHLHAAEMPENLDEDMYLFVYRK